MLIQDNKNMSVQVLWQQKRAELYISVKLPCLCKVVLKPYISKSFKIGKTLLMVNNVFSQEFLPWVSLRGTEHGTGCFLVFQAQKLEFNCTPRKHPLLRMTDVESQCHLINLE